MKPVLKDGKLLVELHKPDITFLRRVRDFGRTLAVMREDLGVLLVEDASTILQECGVETIEPPAEAATDIEATDA